MRRTAQLRAVREDLQVVAIGGNVDTRLQRLAERGGDRRDGDGQRGKAGGGEREDGLDAIMLARAGLQRLGREAEIGAVLDHARFVPAPGQGALALEGRAEDGAVAEAVRAITDADTFACLRAERIKGRVTYLNVVAEQLTGWSSAEALGRRVAERMIAAGSGELLRRAEEMAVEHA